MAHTRGFSAHECWLGSTWFDSARPPRSAGICILFRAGLPARRGVFNEQDACFESITRAGGVPVEAAASKSMHTFHFIVRPLEVSCLR